MKRLAKWTGYVVLPVAVLFLLALLKWESLSYGLLKKGMEFYAKSEHIALNVGEITGRLFSATTVYNLTMHPAEGQPQEYHLKTGSLACTYNLWDLKKGLEFFISGLHCSVADTVFSYDFSVASAEEKPDEEEGNGFVPAIVPRLKIKNSAVLLSHTRWAAEIKGLDGMLFSSPEQGHELTLEAGSVRFRQEGITKVDTGFRTRLRYGDGRLSLESLEVGDKEISAAGFIDMNQIAEGYAGFAFDLAFAESLLSASGSVEKWLLQGRVRSDNFDVGELQKRLGGSWNMYGNIRGSADIIYNLETKAEMNGSFSLALKEGQVNGVAVETLTVAGSFDKEIFSVSMAEAETPGNYLSLSDVSVPMELLQNGDLLSIFRGGQAQVTADMSDVPEFLKLFNVERDVIPEGLSPSSLKIWGRLEKGALYLADVLIEADGTRLTIKQATIPVPESEKVFYSTPLDMTARVESSNIEKAAALFGHIPVAGQLVADIQIAGSIRDSVVSINLKAAQLGFRGKSLGSLTLLGKIQVMQETPGVLKSLEFTVSEFTQINDYGTLTLLTAGGTWLKDTFSVRAQFQLDEQGKVIIRIDQSPGKKISAEVNAHNLDSRGWLALFIEKGFFFHGADVKAIVQGLPEIPEVHLDGSVGEMGSDGIPFPFTGHFVLDYSPKGIDIEKFVWSSHNRNKINLTGFVPYDPLSPDPFPEGSLSVKGNINFPALEDIAFLLEGYGIGKGAVSLDLDLRGTWKQPVGHILLEAREIELLGPLKDYLGLMVNYSSDIVADRDTITLKSATLESSAYSAQAAGFWKHGQSVKKLLRKGTAELEGELSADAAVEMKDLNLFRNSLPGLRRVEGEMKGEIHLAGPITGPTFQGTFSLRDGEVSHTFSFPMLSAVNLQGTFDEHSIHIDDMQAELGGSPVSLKGMITREGEVSNVSLRLDGSNVLLFRSSDMRVRGDVHLEVAGPPERLTITGTTGLTGGYYTKNFDFLAMIGSSSEPVSEGTAFLFSFPSPPLRDAVFDIKITSIEPFRIKNNLIRGTLRPQLSLKGTGELPFMVGTVYIDPSRVLLPSGRLQIQSGVLRFLEGDPERPQLDLLAQSKVLGYDINVVTRGPIDDPVVTLSSSPSLPNDDLLLLLLTGQPPREQAGAGVRSSGATNVIVYLGRDFLSKWLDDDPGASDETILDRFELDIGRGFTRSGEQTVESTFRLSDDLTGTGRVYYLSGEKDKYDFFNYGLKVVFRLE